MTQSQSSQTTEQWTPAGAALGVPCPRCEARVGVACTTLSGKRTAPHASRWEPLAEAYAAGLEDAR